MTLRILPVEGAPLEITSINIAAVIGSYLFDCEVKKFKIKYTKKSGELICQKWLKKGRICLIYLILLKLFGYCLTIVLLLM
jgi:hypothetical protein